MYYAFLIASLFLYLSLSQAPSILSVCAHPEQSYILITGDEAGYLLGWDIRKGTAPVFCSTPPTSPSSLFAPQWSVQFHHLRPDVVFSCDEGGRTHLWRLHAQTSIANAAGGGKWGRGNVGLGLEANPTSFVENESSMMSNGNSSGMYGGAGRGGEKSAALPARYAFPASSAHSSSSVLHSSSLPLTCLDYSPSLHTLVSGGDGERLIFRTNIQ